MSQKENPYRVLHNLLENPIFRERLAQAYETLTDSPTNLGYRIRHFQKICDNRNTPQTPVMKKICEAYRMLTTRLQGYPDTRDITTIESELLSIYNPISQ